MEKGIDKTRERLIKMMKGEPQFYEIIFSVDIKGIITIWGGQPINNMDLFMQKPTEEYLHLYDGWKHGSEMAQMEANNAQKIPREELIRSFLEFRQKHPTDGFGFLYGFSGDIEDGTRSERDDKKEVERELRKRNREYIFELYGEKLPVDFDFKKDYDNRMMRRN